MDFSLQRGHRLPRWMPSSLGVETRHLIGQNSSQCPKVRRFGEDKIGKRGKNGTEEEELTSQTGHSINLLVHVLHLPSFSLPSVFHRSDTTPSLLSSIFSPFPRRFRSYLCFILYLPRRLRLFFFFL